MNSESFTLELINQLKNEGSKTREAVKSICYELLEYSISHEDYRGQTYALYYLGELRFRHHKYKQSLEYLLKGFELFHHYKEDDHNIDYCILIGKLYTKLGDEQKAFDYFYSGMKLAKRNQNYLKQGSLYCNISTAYAKLSAYEEALKHFMREKQCYQNLMKDQAHKKKDFILDVVLNINIGLTYCSMHKYDLAYPILKDVEHHSIDTYEEYLLSYYALKIKTFYGLKRFQASLKYVKLFRKRASMLPDILDNFDDCYDILFELLSLYEIEEAKNYLELLRTTAFDIGAVEYKSKYYDALLQFELRNGSKEEFVKSFETFLELEEYQEKEFKEMKLSNLRDKKMIESTAELKRLMMHNMSIIKEKSEKDALTKLANRYCLNEYCEEKFQEAKNRKVTIGIDVIDIDYFKHYNDCFGHLYGDYCLVQVAEAMREAAGNHFLARFGGDEFFIIFFDTSTEKIVETAKRLQQILMDKKIMQAEGLPYECITISQGIVNQIPEAGQTMSDFIHTADSALYKGKKMEKNAIYIAE